MNKKTKQLLKENNRLEKQLSIRADEVLTDMVVYLRGSKLTEYDQELVRRDITNMLIDGEARGQSPEEVIGDYRAFCDAIIDESKKRTKKEELVNIMSVCFECLGILLAIMTVCRTIEAFVVDGAWRVTFSLGDLITAVLLIALAAFVVDIICRGAFEKKGRRDWIIGLSFGLAVAVCMLPSFLIKLELATMNSFSYLLTAVVLIVIGKLLSRK